MILEHRFFTEFNQGMRLGNEIRYHIDDWSYFITWPLVYVLKKTSVTPNQICFLSFLSGMGFLVGLLLGYSITNHYLLTFLLGSRILLDSADGQLARYSDQKSNLGALYDLGSDFIFIMLLFVILTFLIISQGNIAPLQSILICLTAFLSFVVTTTVHSYLVLSGESTARTPLVLRETFTSGLPNDRPQNPAYTRKLNLFNVLFGMTWRPASLVVTSILGKNIFKKNNRFLLHALSLTEYGMHLLILWIIVLTRSPLQYFLIFEITVFCVTVNLLSLTSKKSDIGSV